MIQLCYRSANAGTVETRSYGRGRNQLSEVGRIWFYDKGIANVLSLACLREDFNVVLEDIGLVATGKDGSVLVFEERACGLFAMPESSDLFRMVVFQSCTP